MERLLRWIREMHRRSLWQALGIYLVASWAVLQFVDTLVGALGLPDWLPPFALALLLVGLPIVLATAVIQEAASVRDLGESDSGGAIPASPVRRLFTWRNALAGGVGAFALWGVVAGAWLLWRPEPPGASPGNGAATRRAIAVLPFENLMAEASEQYFVDGMTEQLITELAKVSGLTVISRTSVMRYRDSGKTIPEIAAELDVDAIVEGSVLRVADRVRITAQLIDASTDTHLWADSYDRSIEDVLALHSEVARAVVDGVSLLLTPEDEAQLARADAVVPAAYEAYLRGRFWWNQRTDEGFRNAIASFEEALAFDSTYAPAWAGLADARALRGYYGSVPPSEGYAEATRLARRALALDDGLAEAHTSLGGALLFYEWDWEGAEREFRRAIALNPSYATAHHWYWVLLSIQGRREEAREQITRAREVDPFSLIINRDIGKDHYYRGDYDAAERALRETLAIESSFFLAHWYVGRVYEQRGEYAEAIRAYETTVALSNRSPIQLAALGHAYARSGDLERASGILDELEAMSRVRYVDAHGVGEIHLAMGDLDEAFRWFDRAYDERSVYLIYLGVDPRYEEVRSDPRFSALLDRMGLSG